MSPRPPKRIVLSPEAIRGAQAVLRGGDFHHVVRVMRRREGDELICSDGLGTTYRGVLERVDHDRHTATVRLTSSQQAEASGGCAVQLIHGLARNQRTEWILQKGTELGVDVFLPAICEHSVVRPADHSAKQLRWNEIVRQAARQCERPNVPHVAEPAPLLSCLEKAQAATLKLVAQRGGQPLWSLFQAHDPHGVHAVLLVGPEGGLSPAEQYCVESAGFLPVSLGPRTLRSETAALTLAAATALWLDQIDPADNR